MKSISRKASDRARRLSGCATMALSVGLLGLSTPAFAQDAEETVEETVDGEGIVVTGTLIRGSSPVGSNSITLDSERFDETGATSANELLASVPQVTNYFNRVPATDLAVAVNQIQIARPNIRNISPNNASSSATLILVDGHRVATAGVAQASVDPDLLPVSAIERVEVVLEGGSAIYGADAVAGVINFVTRKRFDGLEVGGQYGFADNYWQWDANAIVGKDWGTGSLFAAYSYAKSDALFGRERDFIRDLDYTRQPYVGRDRECAAPNLAVNTVFTPANFTISAVNYATPGLAANTFNACDNSQNESIVPRMERHGLLVGFTQDLDATTTVDMRAYYGQRETQASSVLTGTVNVNAGNPFVAGNLPAGVTLREGVVATRAAVSFSLEPLLGRDSQSSDTSISQWGFNVEVKKDLSNDWQLRGLLNWGETDSRFSLTGIDGPRLAAAGIATTTATAFNPFDVTRNNPALIADLIDSETAGQVRNSLLNARFIAEGKLFALPGGDARLAVGYEHMDDTLQQRTGIGLRIGAISGRPFTEYSRNVNSAFGELQLPVLGDGEGGSMLTLSAAGRYDDYSDFGGTFNPKLGANFRPTDWLSLRANWGTSFTAPTPLDQLGSARNTITAFPFVPFTRPGDTVLPGSFTLALQGSQPNLQPQTADTWSVGLDLTPGSGFRASASYYDVNFENILGTPTPNAGIFANFPGNVTTNVAGLSPDQIRAFGALAPGGSVTADNLVNAGTRVYALVDFRTGNFGALRVKGLDFNANYQLETGFGSLDFGVNGNYQLARDQRASPQSPTVDVLALDTPKLVLQTQLGATVGNLRAQATWNHSGGFDINPTNSVPVQDRVGSFDVANLFFKYEVPAQAGVLQDLAFTVNVTNVFDAEPPVLFRNNPGDLGFANGFTLGRMFIFGVNKKF